MPPALIDTIAAILRADTIDIVRATLETVRRAFGWAYASYWRSTGAERTRVLARIGHGRRGVSARHPTAGSGKARGSTADMAARDLVFVAELAELADCCRAPWPRRDGIHSGVCLPHHAGTDQVIGTMDFFATQSVEMSPVRLEVLRFDRPGRASERSPGSARQERLSRIMRMIENCALNMMYTDLDLKIQYMNPASIRTLKRLEQYLPIKVGRHDRQADRHLPQQPGTPAAAAGRPQEPAARGCDPARARVAEPAVSAILDNHGKYVGPMLTWEVVTEQVEAKQREAETAADTDAINQLLVALGQARTKSDVVTAALWKQSAKRSAGHTRPTSRSTRRTTPSSSRGRLGHGRRGIPARLSRGQSTAKVRA